MVANTFFGLIVATFVLHGCITSSQINRVGLYQTRSISVPKHLAYTYTEQTNTEHRPTKLDPKIPSEWALVNIGFFTHFTALAQPINAKIKSCSKSVVVAVVDTGIDYNHVELKDNLWHNKGEIGLWSPPANSKSSCRDKSCNDIDDDKNGFKDDVIGWDFVFNRPAPFDTHGHGTHISGIIGATAANGKGVFGVCPGVSIMALKYYDNSGVGFNNLTNTVRAIHYAVNNGAHIINYSGGGSDPAPAEKIAIQKARDKGILVIAAAGNNGIDLTTHPYYPASYGLDNIISVGATMRSNQLLPSSGYGSHSVDVAGPGMMIYNSLPSQRFGTMSGSSQATAFVSGLAALLLSQTLDKNTRSLKRYLLIKRLITQGAVPIKNIRTVRYGLISITNSLNLLSDKILYPIK